jgi:hypothetical protein
MRHDIQEMPFITFDVSNYSAEVTSPDAEAAYKRLPELTIDEALIFRQMDFFPNGDDEKRQYILTTRVDAMFRRALWALTSEHPKTISSNNRFVAIALGAMICNEKYYHGIHELRSLYSIAINSEDDHLFTHADTHAPIIQRGPLKRINIGFTQREHDRIETLSDELGMTVSGLMIVFFWMGAVTSTKIDEVFIDYGESILLQFKKHMSTRVHNLSYNNFAT